MTEKLKVSVVIPTYNEEANIKTVLESVLNSSYNNVEIIVVDDGSTDGTRQILEDFSDVKKIFLQHKGKPHALNAGIKEASGDFILQIDADCVLDEKSIGKMISQFSDENVVAVWGAVEVANKDKFFPALMHSAKKLNPVYLHGGANVMFRAGFIKTQKYSETEKGFSGEDFEVREEIEGRRVRQVYIPNARVYTKYPEELGNAIRERFRWARSYVRFMRKKFSWRKLFPIFRDLIVSFGLIALIILGFYIPALVLLGSVFTYLMFRAVKIYNFTKNSWFSFASIFAEFFFIFTRAVGYLREAIR